MRSFFKDARSASYCKHVVLFLFGYTNVALLCWLLGDDTGDGECMLRGNFPRSRTFLHRTISVGRCCLRAGPPVHPGLTPLGFNH